MYCNTTGEVAVNSPVHVMCLYTTVTAFMNQYLMLDTSPFHESPMCYGSWKRSAFFSTFHKPSI